jgi:hypothetical protein
LWLVYWSPVSWLLRWRPFSIPRLLHFLQSSPSILKQAVENLPFVEFFPYSKTLTFPISDL